MDVGVGDGLQRLGRGGVDVAQDHARAQHQVVVHHVAARLLDGADQAHGGLLAEGAREHHLDLVLRLARFTFQVGAYLLQDGIVLLHRHHRAGAHHVVQFLQGHAPGVILTYIIDPGDQAPVGIVQRDGAVQGLGRHLLPVDLLDVVHHVLHLLLVEHAAHLGQEVLREVHVLHELAQLVQLEDAREVAQHVADAREDVAVEVVGVVVHHQVDDAARDMADVGLVVGVAFDDLLAVAPAEDAHRQAARSVDHLAGEVHRHVAHHHPVGMLLLPFARAGELQVEGVFLADADPVVQRLQLSVVRLHGEGDRQR